MNFRIADTFTDSLTKLTGEEQKAALHKSSKSVKRSLVERNYNGAARVAGSARTGKTIVALHRAFWLARQHEDARVLLTTFSDPLADALRSRLHRLIHHKPMLAERIDMLSIDSIARRIGRAKFSPQKIASTELWELFEQIRQKLATDHLVTQADIYAKITKAIQTDGKYPFQLAVVDEAQDIGVPELRFLAAMGNNRPDSLFFAGAPGQRIFRQPFPLQERIETVADTSDLEEVYNTERHLLYVACTRARDRLLVTTTKPASEFLDDLQLD